MILRPQDGGEPLQGSQRLGAYHLCQSILSRRNDCLVLFDEIEDVFPEPPILFFGSRPKTDGIQAWLNRVLETNPVPTLWVTNDISQINSAYLRRFDFVLELGNPPRTWRRRIIERHTSSLPVRETWMERAAGHESHQPAHIERAARVARLVGGEQPEEVEQILDRVLHGTLKTLGAPLGRSGRPILVRRASDLISKSLGETAKSLAEMFRHAEAEDAVLLLDEADGFLRDRATAVRSWEVTQVNEFLVQMEAYQELFIASTNLLDTLDAASLRRFDLKIHFDHMRPEQSWPLFVQIMQERGFPEHSLPAEKRQKLRSVTNLTPGDYATALRREGILGETFDPEALLQALEGESAAKPGAGRRGIGFTAVL